MVSGVYVSYKVTSGPKVIIFFMLNLAEHEILTAHKYKTSRNTVFFFICSGSDKPRMIFFLLINVNMPTVVGILTFMSRKTFMLS